MLNGEKFKRNITKILVIVLAIIILTPLIFSMAEEYNIVNTEEEYTYIDFGATWNSNYTSIEEEKEGLTGSTYYIYFNTGFNTVGEFKNFKLTAEDITNDEAVSGVNIEIQATQTSPFSSISQNKKTLVYETSVAPGKEGRGKIAIKCDVEKFGVEAYQRKIKVNLTGTHEVNGVSYEVNLVRILTLNLKTERTLSNLTIYNSVSSKEYTFDADDNLTGQKVIYQITVNHNIDIKELNLEFQAYKDGEKKGSITNAYAKVNSNSYEYAYKEDDGTYSITRKQSTIFEEGNSQVFYIEVFYPRTRSEIAITLGNIVTVTVKSENVNITKEQQTIEEVELTKESINSFDDTYTDGDAGITIYANQINNRNNTLSNKQVEMITNGENLELNYHTNVNWKNQGQVNSKVYVRNYNYGENISKITYTSDEGTSKTIELNENNMIVKSIYISNWLDGIENIKFYKKGQEESEEPFFTATKTNRSYTLEEEIGEYYAVINGVPKGIVDIDWTTTWCLLSEKLSISETEKANIKSITRYQRGIYEVDTNGNKNEYDLTLYSNASYNVPQDTSKATTSYIDVSQSNVDTKISDIGKKQESSITLTMKENDWNSFYNSYSIENEKPIIYVKLIKDFEYDYDTIQVTENNSNTKIKLKEQEIEVIQIGEEEYLKIPFTGIYTATTTNSTEYAINVSFTRSLKTGVTNYNKEVIKIYMQTDGGAYYNGIKDTNDINQNGNSVETLGYTSISHTIITNEGVELLNQVIDGTGETENTNTNTAIASPGEEVTYKLETINNWTKSIQGINIVSRLPFIGNKSVKNPETSQMETEITPEFIGIKKVYKIDKYGRETTLTNYTVGYSENETAGFDSEYTSSSENVKTMQIKLPDTYTLGAGERIIVEYTVKVPETSEKGKKFGEQYCIKYRITGNSDEIIATEPEAIYVSVEEEKTGTIQIQKTFEGIPKEENGKDVEPLSGIEFKIIGIDNENSYNVTTNSDGVAIQDNIPKGKYKIEEVTKYENYESVSKIVEISKKGETKEIEIENTAKRGSIKITKTWEKASNNLEEVTLKLEGTTVTGEKFTETGKTTNGILEIINIPFGTYQITETSKTKGWYLEPVTVEINQNQKEAKQEIGIENKIAYGTISLKKEMPEQETYYTNAGVKLWVYGASDVTYIDKETEEEVTLEVNEVVTTDETGKAILENVPVGTYTIEELEVPEITLQDGSKETRYKKIEEEVQINENLENVEKTIKNEWKTGNLTIKVKVEPEGPDLTMFTVKVHGSSYYAKTNEETGEKEEDVNIEITPDKDGNIQISDMLLGNYKIEEINVPDGFEVEPEVQEIEVKYNKTQKAEILNKYIGQGTVKIIKTAEGNEQDGIEGIKFKIYGKDQAGRDVSETITTNSEGIATSNNIMAGTYVLEEIKESVPNKYRTVESQDIKIETGKEKEIQIYNEYKRGTIKVETIAEGPDELIKTVTGTKYKIEKIENGKTTEEQEITVDKTGKFELKNIIVGQYKISQIEAPKADKGIKITLDMAQTEELEDNQTLELVFMLNYDIKEESDAPKTKVILTKEIINEEEQNVGIDEEFEVSLINITTGATYNSFVNTQKEQIIEGLPYGIYEIKEREKIEYNLYGYRKDNEGKLELEEEKVIFSLTEQEDGSTDTVNIAIINMEDKGHGFGRRRF